MPATVPLTTPVTSLTAARAVAESAALADGEAAVGPAIDRILIFLSTLRHAALMPATIEILDVFALLNRQRAARATGWLARRAVDEQAREYWDNLNDLFLHELLAAS